MIKKRTGVLLGLFFTAVSLTVALQSSARYRLFLGGREVSVELALTQEARARGLMYRRTLDDGTGMLFVFPDEAYRSFWMKNTYVPLSIAFLDARWRIVSMHDMQPLDETTVRSALPARFALEVPQGWFRRNGIGPGVVVRPGMALKQKLAAGTASGEE